MFSSVSGTSFSSMRVLPESAPPMTTTDAHTPSRKARTNGCSVRSKRSLSVESTPYASSRS